MLCNMVEREFTFEWALAQTIEKTKWSGNLREKRGKNVVVQAET